MAVNLVRNSVGSLEIRKCDCLPKPRPERLSAFDVQDTLYDIRFLDNPTKEPTNILVGLWMLVVFEFDLWKAKKYLERYAR